MHERRRPAEVWGGEPSGERFAALVAARAAALGMDVVVQVTPYALVGGYVVSVDWGEGHDQGLLYEVADWVEGVRILDPHGEDVSVHQALDYLTARIHGRTPAQALTQADPRRRWWQRRHR